MPYADADALAADLASTNSGKGFGLLGLNTSSAIELDTGQVLLDHVLGTGTIHASAFGLTSHDDEDQFDELSTAIAYCSERRMTLDITGLEIRVGKQSTSNAAYLYVNGSVSSGAAGRVYTGASGEFQVGEAVTGGTSGASMTVTSITSWDTASGILFATSGVTDGPFVAGETLTGGTSGTTATAEGLGYAIGLGEDGWMRIVGKGTIGSLHPDMQQYIFHAEGAKYIEIGDGVTLDGHKTMSNGGGGTCHFMGVEQVHLGEATFYRDGIVRLGSSPNGMTQLCTFTKPRFIDGWGTHAIGGKPGGCREWRGDTIYVNNTLGGINIEAEDQNNFNTDTFTGDGVATEFQLSSSTNAPELVTVAGAAQEEGADYVVSGTTLTFTAAPTNGAAIQATGIGWSTKIVANIGFVVAEGIDGTKVGTAGASTSSGFAVVVSDSNEAVADIGSITVLGGVGNDHSGGAVVIGGGQSNLAPALVRVGHIHADTVEQIVNYSATQAGGETIVVGKVTGRKISNLLRGRDIGGLAGTPAPARLVSFGEIDVDDAGLGNINGSAFNSGYPFYVKNGSAHPGRLLDRLLVGACRIGTCNLAIGNINDVNTIEFTARFSTDGAMSALSSGQVGFVLSADCTNFIVRDGFDFGVSPDKGISINASGVMDITGLAGTVNAAATRNLLIRGTGEVILRNIDFSANPNSEAIRASSAVTAEAYDVWVGAKTLNANITFSRTEGGDILNGVTVATLMARAPAATAAVGTAGFVTDASAPAFGATVSGGGATPIGVKNTGASWIAA